MQVSIVKGHNQVKFSDIDLEAGAFVATKELLEFTARNALMNIPFFKESNNEGSEVS